MKQQKLPVVAGLVASTLMMLMPLTAWAADGDQEPATTPLAPVIITEVQPGVTGGSADDEFIELYNTTDQDLDISGWQLWYNPKVAVVADPPAIPVAAATIVMGDGGSGAVTIPAGGYYLLTSRNYSLAVADGVGNQSYPFTMTYDASLRLFSLDKTECTLHEIDRVGWGATLVAEGAPAKTTSSKRGIARMTNDSSYVDSGINADDFRAIDTSHGPDAEQPTNMTPGKENGVDFTPSDPTTYEPSVYNTLSNITVSASNCADDEPVGDPDDTGGGTGGTTVPPESWPPAEEGQTPEDTEDAAEGQPVIPTGNIGLKAPVMSELLPNPASPLTDANDEFIELYNPNDAYFDLNGYVLEVGLTTRHRYTIPAGTELPPRSFLAFFAAQTNLAMSNSGGQAALLDPLGRLLARSDPYGTAKDGQAWVFAGGIWRWTTTPTPNAINVVSAPAVKAKSTTKKTTILAASAKKTGSNQSSAGATLQEDVGQAAAVAASSSTPLHPGVLALIAVSAVLYGAYEYRRDVANRIYQFRADRAARRALRRGAEGR